MAFVASALGGCAAKVLMIPGLGQVPWEEACEDANCGTQGDDIRLVTAVQRDHLAEKLLVNLSQDGRGKRRELKGAFGAVQSSQDSRQGVVPDPERRSPLMWFFRPLDVAPGAD